jgi:hypothetical protein
MAQVPNTVGSQANIASLSEGTGVYIFPETPDVRSSIPLWMKFYCYEYSNSAINRVAANVRSNGDLTFPTLSNLKAQIMVPSPVRFDTDTSINYSSQPTSAITSLPGFVGNILSVLKSVSPEIKQLVDMGDEGIEKIGDLIGYLEKTAGSFGFGQNLTLPDINDLIYYPSGPHRSFNINLILPCLTIADSKVASDISMAFESLALPTMIGLGSIATSRFFHPPVWIFGVGPIDSLRFDTSWSGQPQLSVLAAVKVKRTSLDVPYLTAISESGLIKPSIYSIGLKFIELEPAFRVVQPGRQVGTNITNRSGAITSFGGIIPKIG